MEPIERCFNSNAPQLRSGIGSSSRKESVQPTENRDEEAPTGISPQIQGDITVEDLIQSTVRALISYQDQQMRHPAPTEQRVVKNFK